MFFLKWSNMKDLMFPWVIGYHMVFCIPNVQFSALEHPWFFLLGTCLPSLSGSTARWANFRPTFSLPSRPSSRDYITFPSIIFPALHSSSLCIRQTKHFNHTTVQASSILTAFESSTCDEDVSLLVWWGLGCRMRCGTSCSISNPPYLLHGVTDFFLFSSE